MCEVRCWPFLYDTCTHPTLSICCVFSTWIWICTVASYHAFYIQHIAPALSPDEVGICLFSGGGDMGAAEILMHKLICFMFSRRGVGGADFMLQRFYQFDCFQWLVGSLCIVVVCGSLLDAEKPVNGSAGDRTSQVTLTHKLKSISVSNTQKRICKRGCWFICFFFISSRWI